MHPRRVAYRGEFGFPQDDRHPVVCVTFQDAVEYAAWISKKSGHVYRPLSEAEWEYAARAGTSTPFPWGTAASHEAANYGGEHPGPGLAQGRDLQECRAGHTIGAREWARQAEMILSACIVKVSWRCGGGKNPHYDVGFTLGNGCGAGCAGHR